MTVAPRRLMNRTLPPLAKFRGRDFVSDQTYSRGNCSS